MCNMLRCYLYPALVKYMDQRHAYYTFLQTLCGCFKMKDFETATSE